MSPDPGHNNAASLRIRTGIGWQDHCTDVDTELWVRRKVRLEIKAATRSASSSPSTPTDVVPPLYCLWSGCFLCSNKSQHIQNHFPLNHAIEKSLSIMSPIMHTYQNCQIRHCIAFFIFSSLNSEQVKHCFRHSELFPRNDALVRKSMMCCMTHRPNQITTYVIIIILSVYVI